MDQFQGTTSLKNLSSRLALGDEIRDEEICDLLGPFCQKPFRYAQNTLKGICRRTTREPAFCHSADIALRALDMGFPGPIIATCLLHDCVEDKSRTLVSISRNLQQIENLLGYEIARDIRFLTNRFSVILLAAFQQIRERLPIEHHSLSRVREELIRQREYLPHNLQQEFGAEFDQLINYFLNAVDLSYGQKRFSIDKSYTLSSELKFQAYWLFIENMCDDALNRPNKRFHEDALVVKCLDMVDNLRTSEVGNWMVIEKILVKAEFILDKSFYLHKLIEEYDLLEQTTFIEVYDYLKNNLVEQLAERNRALSFLADTRFAYLVEFLGKEISRLQNKYNIADTLKTITEKRETIREKNARLYSSEQTD